MAKVFKIPYDLPNLKIGWLNDYICDLMWIRQKKIVLIVHDFEQMLSDNTKTKENIMLDFKEIILPWWEGDVIGHMVGGEPREFLVYLEHTT